MNHESEFRYLHTVLIPALLTFIAIVDIRSHRIPNSTLILLLALALFKEGFHLNIKVVVLSSLLVLTFTWITGCGYGDSKLIIILINFVLPSAQFMNFFFSFLVSSSLLVLIHIVRNRSMQGEIAFAPAICGAALFLGAFSQ